MTEHIDPTREQFSAMMKLPDEGKIHMLNLIKLREKAAYEDGRVATGAEAYAVYGKESAPFFTGVGGKIAWSGAPKCVLIGPEDEQWDLCFVAEYPSAAAFGKMVRIPATRRLCFIGKRLSRIRAWSGSIRERPASSLAEFMLR